MKKLLISTAAAALMLAPAAADFRARIGFSEASLDSVWSGGKFSSDYSSTNYGLSYAFDNGYFVDYSIRAGDDDDNPDNGSADFGTRELGGFSRDETTYTLGKSLGDGLTAFGGITESEYQITVFPGTAGEFTEFVETDGFFLGVSQSYLLDTGVLSLSLAYADMDLDLTYSGDLAGMFIADSGDGFSYSIGYIYPVNDAVSINAEYRSQSYSFDLADDAVDNLGLNLLYSF